MSRPSFGRTWRRHMTPAQQRQANFNRILLKQRLEEASDPRLSLVGIIPGMLMLTDPPLYTLQCERAFPMTIAGKRRVVAAP